jgi:hypothetical protein
MLGIENIAFKVVHGPSRTLCGSPVERTAATDCALLKRISGAIQVAITHPRWTLESDCAIARHVGCDHKIVAAMRRECAGGEFPNEIQLGPSKSDVLRAFRLLSRVQPERARQFDQADIETVRAPMNLCTVF